MIVKKNTIILIALTIFFSLIQWYAWVYRWDNADSNTYFYQFESIENIFDINSYEMSSLLFQPIFVLFGYSIANLVLLGFIYRLFTYYIIEKVNYVINNSIFISFLFFPLHSILSFFPGRDLFCYLLLFLSLGLALKNKYMASLLVVFFASKFRIISTIPLFLALFFEIFSKVKVKVNKSFKTLIAIFAILISFLWLFNNLNILGYGFDLASTLYRVQSEETFTSNLEGFKTFPINFLNLYFPLFSSNLFSPYLLLGIESFYASYLIIKAYFGSNLFSIPRIIKNVSMIQLLMTIFICAIYPNVTDIGRKIYPLFLYASLIIYFLKIKVRKINLNN